MMAQRPFADADAALNAAHEAWFALGPEDWLEAFSHHPKIGDVQSLRRRFPATHDLSAREQGGIIGASDTTLEALAAANRAYEDRFGYIFIVCATGKTAAEMLALLRARLSNDSGTEIRIAAEEQARITALRLKQA
jgi:2-oxo-4-hydroxy-4-carboxy-5-ureidoimidazoline decarboxylase